MKKIQNIVAVTWEYTNSKWETKKNYVTIWKLFTNDKDQLSIKLEAIPVWFTWWANVYDLKEDSTKLPDVSEDLPF